MPIRSFLAQRWLWRWAFWAVPLAIALAVTMPAYPSRMGLIEAALTGGTVGGTVGYMVLHVFHRILAAVNGAPYYRGDYVRLLVGPRKGWVVPVNCVWAERGQVVVGLDGPDGADIEKTVFALNEVCRCPRSESLENPKPPPAVTP